MAATEPLFADFPPVSTEEWQAAIVKDLKGKDPAALLWKTEDGITVKPFYRAEDASNPLLVPDAHLGWSIRYEVTEPDPREARAVALRAIERGAQEIVFADLKITEAAQMAELVGGLRVPVHFRCGSEGCRILPLLVASGVSGLRGSCDYSPVTDGREIDRELLSNVLARNPEFSPIVVRAESYHNAGATTVEELAFAIATGVEYLAQLGKEAARYITFDFAVGPNYFFEIAKLRAARILWAQAQEPFGSAAKMNIHARTSTWNQTVYDPYNNLLRGTTEAMSAAIGGADSLTVVPFDDPYRNPDDFSRHLALNTQLILRDEAHFGKVADPAQGSWYIESLTESIAREAWKLFQQVEVEGGMMPALKHGFVEKTLVKSRESRNLAIAQRRRIFVGTNAYPNLSEKVLDAIDKPLSPERGPWIFEQIRLATERYAKKAGRTPNVLLVTLGDLKMRRARADFMTNFFGISGFAISEPPAFPNVDAAAEYAAGARADIIVLCSSDAEYPGIAESFLPKLKAAGVDTPVLVAGLPKDGIEQMKAAGVVDFIHIKSNPVETLTAWQRRLGVIE